jgi:hypothetical protein
MFFQSYLFASDQFEETRKLQCNGLKLLITNSLSMKKPAVISEFKKTILDTPCKFAGEEINFDSKTCFDICMKDSNNKDSCNNSCTLIPTSYGSVSEIIKVAYNLGLKNANSQGSCGDKVFQNKRDATGKPVDDLNKDIQDAVTPVNIQNK